MGHEPVASRTEPAWLRRGFLVLALAGAGALFGLAAWLTFEVPKHPLARGWSGGQHDRLLPSMEAWLALGAFAALGGGALLARLRNAEREVARLAVGVASVAGVALLLRVYTGPTVTFPMVALCGGVAAFAGLALGPVYQRLVDRNPAAARHVGLWVPVTTAFVVYAVWSVTRHQWFGTGSWDLGLYNQNAWLAGHGGPLFSSVIEESHFLGDHFAPVTFLWAPFTWTGQTWILLVVQVGLVTGASIPLAALARRAGLGPGAVFGVTVAFLFAIGTQSMLNFDFHLIAPVPLGLYLAVLGFESDRRWLAYLGLGLVLICKESAILYAGAVGGWLFLTKPGKRVEGAAIAAFCLAFFWIVVSKVQPYLLSLGAPKPAHFDAYKAFGDTLGEALANMVRHPGKVLVVLVTPEQKAETLLISFGGFGFLALGTPSALWLALPNLVERFLGSKREMWGLSFHYSLTLLAILAWASVQTIARLERACARRRTRALDDGLLSRLARPGVLDLGVAVFLLLTTVGTMRVYPREYDLQRLFMPYFSSAEGAAINHRALEIIPPDGKVMAQNHFVPHLSFRELVWRLQPRFLAKADWVVVNPDESPWPHDRDHVLRLTRRLFDDPAWTLVFSEGTTAVFEKGGERAVPPTADLRRVLGR